MTTASRLPWVTAPFPGEWLGYWLLRVGSVYGLQLRALLTLAGVTGVRFVEPTRARLASRPLLDWSGMSVLLGESLARLRRMQALASPPSKWAQLGCCTSCLGSDLRNARTPYWRCAWMDPYVVVCARHRRLLQPVESRIVRALVDLRQSTRLLTRLAAEETAQPWLQATPGEIGALARLQARIRPGCSRIPLFLTHPVRLRRHIDALAVDLYRSGKAGPVALVHTPQFGGWLAGVRDLRARQSLLQGVIRLAADDLPRTG